MKDFNVTASNASGLYDALSRLTLNRSGNRGTIAVGMNDDGSYTLSCVNHKIFGRNNYKVTEGNANELRKVVRDAVEAELTKAFDKLPNMASPAESMALRAKLNEVRDAFEDMINRSEGNGHKIGFTRKDIESVLLNVNALKESLDIDCLMKMDARSLAHLTESSNKNQAAQIKADRARVEADSQKRADTIKFIDELLSYQPTCQPTREGAFMGGMVTLLEHGIRKIHEDAANCGVGHMPKELSDETKDFLDRVDKFYDPKDPKDGSIVDEAFVLLRRYKDLLDAGDCKVGQNPYVAVDKLLDKITALKTSKSALADFLNTFLKQNFPGSSFVFKADDDIVGALTDDRRFSDGMEKLYDFLYGIHGFDDADSQLTNNNNFLTVFEHRVKG